MNIRQINKKFSQGITWNAFFYTFRKGLSIFSTFLLYKKLSMLDFSIWANINSFIFLILLWLDFGFRKSLPRYCPQFAKNKSSMKRFIRYIVRFQATILTIAVTVFLLLAKTISYRLNITHMIDLLYLCCALFALEGILSVMRLIYYSYFWQKQFNLVMSSIITVKSLTLLAFIFLSYPSTTLLRLIFITEIIAGLLAVICTIFMLKHLYKDKSYPGNQTIDFKETGKAFIKHSGIMWLNNNLKSLTERNFMIIILTKLLGPYWSNLFKLANDGALLFQRTVLKTIGTTDTSLLSYIQTLADGEKRMPAAFHQLIKRIASLSIPLLGILFIVVANFRHVFDNIIIFEAFCLITICYLVESLLSPYERILEVKRHYPTLAIAYLPYIVFIISILCFPIIPIMGLLWTIVLIHAVRFASYLIMLSIVRTQQKLTFPVAYTIKLLLITIAISASVSLTSKLVANHRPTRHCNKSS